MTGFELHIAWKWVWNLKSITFNKCMLNLQSNLIKQLLLFITSYIFFEIFIHQEKSSGACMLILFWINSIANMALGRARANTWVTRGLPYTRGFGLQIIYSIKTSKQSCVYIVHSISILFHSEIKHVSCFVCFFNRGHWCDFV